MVSSSVVSGYSSVVTLNVGRTSGSPGECK